MSNHRGVPVSETTREPKVIAQVRSLVVSQGDESPRTFRDILDVYDAIVAERDANSALADAAIDNATRWEAENVQLRARLAACERDSERLNWLADHYHHFRVNKPYGGWDFATQKPGVWSWSDTYKPFLTLRDAIDACVRAAVAAETQGEKDA